MKNTMRMTKISTLGALFFGLVTPALATPITDKQDSIQAKLSEVERSSFGISIYGDAKALAESGMLLHGAEGSTERKTQAYTQGDITIEGRANKDLSAKVEFRLHQDWSNYYDEGPNPFVTRWFSLDGSVLDDHLQLHVGDFHYKNTPLTAWAFDQQNFLYEPLYFSQKKKEIKEENRMNGAERAFQGVHFNTSTNDAISENFALRAEGAWARLRHPWWNTGITQYDTYPTEKFFYDLELEMIIAGGIRLGANYLRTFDNVESSRSYNTANSVYSNTTRFSHIKLIHNDDGSSRLIYEDNSVLSGTFNFSLTELNPKTRAIFDLDFEYARSNYDLSHDVFAVDSFKTSFDGSVDSGFVGIEEIQDSSYSANAFHSKLVAGYDGKTHGFTLTANGIYNEKNFVSDLAQTNTFQNQGIYTAGSQSFLGVFDGLYNHTYEIRPSTEIVSFEEKVSPVSDGEPYNGTNNYFRAAYAANAQNPAVLSKRERDAAGHSKGSVTNIFLPQGYATANRQGVDVSLVGSFGQRAIEVTAVGGWNKLVDFSEEAYNQKNKENLKYGGGVKFRLAGLLDLSNELNVYGSFVEQTHKEYSKPTEKNATLADFSKLKSDIINVGLDLGIGSKVTLLAGFQMIKFTNDHFWYQSNANVTNLKVGELLNTYKESNFGGGVQVQVAKGSYIKAGYSHILGEREDPSKDKDGKDIIETKKLNVSIPSIEYRVSF